MRTSVAWRYSPVSGLPLWSDVAPGLRGGERIHLLETSTVNRDRFVMCVGPVGKERWSSCQMKILKLYAQMQPCA